MRWFAVIGLLLAGWVVGPVLFFILLLNEPQQLGEPSSSYRVFALFTSGVVALVPVAVVAALVGRHQRRLLQATILGLVLPILAMAAGAAYAAVQVWG